MATQPLLSKRNTIARGYAAFNAADWETLTELLHEDVVWHGMHGAAPISKRAPVLAELQRLRESNEAEFFGTAIHQDEAISVDFTHAVNDSESHACADRIRFEDGRIREVWHCVTHQHTGGTPASG